MKSLAYVLMIGYFLLAFGYIDLYQQQSRQNAILREAVTPDNLLLNSRFYILKKADMKGMFNLREAIRIIKKIENQADTVSKAHLKTACLTLQTVLDEMKAGTFQIDHVNAASILTLNALTYYQIKTAKQYILENRHEEARTALKHGLQHVKNARKFAEGRQKDYGLRFYSQMSEIIESNNLMDGTVIKKLEDMLDELEETDVAYHY